MDVGCLRVNNGQTRKGNAGDPQEISARIEQKACRAFRMKAYRYTTMKMVFLIFLACSFSILLMMVDIYIERKMSFKLHF